MRVVSDYCNLVRQSARGFYGNAVLAESEDLRLFGICQQCYEELKVAVVESRPGFSDPRFHEQLARDMTDLRGRELAGFHNSQAFYNFVAQNVESWRPAVVHCRNQVVHASRSVCNELVQRVVPSYPKLAATMYQVAAGLINDQSDALAQRLEDVFVKESDPFTTNENMLELINQTRFRKFDRALQHVMNSVAKPGDSQDSVEAQVIQTLGGWYMNTHGVNTTSRVEDMTIMIEAYWDVATKRLVDNVCMTIEHDFLSQVLRRLESECFLLATDVTRKQHDLDALFSEDPLMQSKRRQLFEKKDRLAHALATLRSMAPNCVAEKPPESELGVAQPNFLHPTPEASALPPRVKPENQPLPSAGAGGEEGGARGVRAARAAADTPARTGGDGQQQQEMGSASAEPLE